MEFKRNDMLNALKSKSIDNGPNATKFKTQDIVKNIDKVVPNPSKTPDKIDQMAVIKKMNGELASPSKGIKFEATWRPQATTVKAITQNILTESVNTPNASPNAFRLDLKSIVLDKCHSKFNIKRNNSDAVVELIYPNANGKITVKLHVEGVDDTVYEVGLEDSQYTTNFGASIIKSVDTILQKKESTTPSFSTPSQFSNPNVSVSSFSPNWVQNGYAMESDARHMMHLMALVEQDEGKPEEELPDETADAGAEVDAGAEAGVDGADAGVEVGGEAGDVNADNSFGAEDFSMGGGGGDLGGGSMGGGGADLGGMGGGADAGAGDVNADAGSTGLEDSDEYASFKEFAFDNFTTTKDGVIDVLSNIVADGVGKQLNNSTHGVKLTSYQISNGMQGLNTRPAKEIIDAFLELYPKLDGEFKVKDLEALGEKLEERPSPTEFNQFLEGYMKELDGQNAGDTDVLQLPNAQIDPMGGEQPVDQAQPTGNFTDNAQQLAGATPAPEAPEAPPVEGEEIDDGATDDDVQGTLRKAAEMETGAGPELNEFPNV